VGLDRAVDLCANESPVSADGRSLDVSDALLAAALSGLLWMAPACQSSSNPSEDTPIPATACDAGVSPSPKVTSSTVVVLTEDAFKARCATRGGVMELQPHCGGSNECRGMSYDSETQTLTEHTCRGTNSCAGFSCVICS